MAPSLEKNPVTQTHPSLAPPTGWAVAFLAALQFLTVVPPLIRRPFTAHELGHSVGWFPLVGLLLGGLLVLIDWLLGYLFPPGVTAALILATWVLCTGALHLDGFLDSCDGLFGGHTPESRLRIMRDERVGAYAVIGGLLLLVAKFAALAEAEMAERRFALLVAPVVGRWAMSLAVVCYPYARPEGLGRCMKDHAGRNQGMLASAIAVAVVVGVTLAGTSWRASSALLLGAVATWAVGTFVLRRLPGLTGDVYGALCEITELAVLLAFVAGGADVA